MVRFHNNSNGYAGPTLEVLRLEVAVAPKLARETAVRLRKAVSVGDVGALSSVASSLPPESYYAFRIRELSELFDLDGLAALADDMEQAAGTET